MPLINNSIKTPCTPHNLVQDVSDVFESWIELSASALYNNIAFYRSIVSAEKKIGVVVKSNAYGHGMIQIAQLLDQHAAVDYLLVAQVSEGIALRSNGIIKPIMLLNPLRNNLETLIRYNLEPMITDMDTIERLSTLAQVHGQQLKIHVKIDTGLSRFGFDPAALPMILAELRNHHALKIESIYTHFAESNNSNLSYTLEQQQTFNRMLELVREQVTHVSLIHTSNSAGITSITHNDASTFVRLGAGAYGIWPSEQTRTVNWNAPNYQHLLPVLAWKTKIVHCKTVPANTFVGYNRTYITDKQTRIGIIPVGYYDGFDKRLSNKGVVRIAGQSAPIIGTIGMNAAMIDITHIPSAHNDTVVILLGNEPAITCADIAQQTGCFNARQITTALNPLIPRIVV